MPLDSAIDVSWLNAFRGRRRNHHEGDALRKLGLLRRLAHPELARLTETRVEQSFNEQLFAQVFGYRTLFSHGNQVFHLLPKNNVGGRFDDFSLGWFGDGEPLVLASAELKSPGCDLDAPVSGRTPVQQALTAASGIAGCRWAIVSNFTEIRLYVVATGLRLVRARLDDIAGRDDLASLCAHFDRAAPFRKRRFRVINAHGLSCDQAELDVLWEARLEL